MVLEQNDLRKVAVATWVQVKIQRPENHRFWSWFLLARSHPQTQRSFVQLDLVCAQLHVPILTSYPNSYSNETWVATLVD